MIMNLLRSRNENVSRIFLTDLFAHLAPPAGANVASSRRPVSRGEAQKTVREKLKKRGERKLSLVALFLFFSLAVFRPAPPSNWTPGRG